MATHARITARANAVTGDGFTAEVLLGWAKASAPPGSPFDASYSVLGLEPVAVGIGDVTIAEAQIADPALRAQTLDLVAQLVAGHFGQVGRLMGHRSRTVRSRPVDVITVAVAYPDGGTGQVAGCFVVGPDRSVVIAASGSERIVARNLDALTATAGSVRFTTQP